MGGVEDDLLFGGREQAIAVAGEVVILATERGDDRVTEVGLFSNGKKIYQFPEPFGITDRFVGKIMRARKNRSYLGFGVYDVEVWFVFRSQLVSNMPQTGGGLRTLGVQAVDESVGDLFVVECIVHFST